jgi:hypothetical protein
MYIGISNHEKHSRSITYRSCVLFLKMIRSVNAEILELANMLYNITPNREAVPNFPPQPPSKAPARMSWLTPPINEAPTREPYVSNMAGEDIAMNDPQKAGLAIDAGNNEATRPVAPTAATEVDSRLNNESMIAELGLVFDFLVNASFHNLMKRAPTTVKKLMGASWERSCPIPG